MGAIPLIKLPSGQSVPVLGQGTWYMGESSDNKKQEIEALQFGIDQGMTLIDTAEMYADGGAEEVVGEALAGRRDDVFLVSKVLPHNASLQGTIEACERSLARLKTDRIDLYLLHWQGQHPLEETLTAFDQLQQQGKIGAWGVSNFDTADMQELVNTAGGQSVATNQVLYNLSRRGPEFDLLPWCNKRNIPVMAYSPVEQGRILGNRALNEVAFELSLNPSTVALAWVIRNGNVIAIPKSSSIDHIRQNRRAVDVEISVDHMAFLDAAFPAPKRKMSLEML